MVTDLVDSRLVSPLREEEELVRQFATNSKLLDLSSAAGGFSDPTGTLTGYSKMQADSLDNRQGHFSDDLVTGINDEEMIEEQRRILEQIERANHAVNVGSSTLTEISSGTGTKASRSPYCLDHVTRVGNLRIRVKGTRHAYDSIAQGSAVVVHCSCCQAVLQVPSSTKNVFCTLCGQVTPMEHALNVSSHQHHRMGVADGDIARKVQVQEIDVASSLKARALLLGGYTSTGVLLP
jgi:hypothetical protein